MAESMSQSFFGVTGLGVAEPLLDATAVATVKEFSFHEIPFDVFEAAFQKFVMGDSALAKTLKMDGHSNILRKDLAHVLQTVLGGRVPTKQELQTWFSFLDFDRGAVMSKSGETLPYRCGSACTRQSIMWIKHVL